MNADLKRRISAADMNDLRRSARISRFERKTDGEVIMHESILEGIKTLGFKWFGHIMRTNEVRWPKKIFMWAPPGKRKLGRTRRS